MSLHYNMLYYIISTYMIPHYIVDPGGADAVLEERHLAEVVPLTIVYYSIV